MLFCVVSRWLLSMAVLKRVAFAKRCERRPAGVVGSPPVPQKWPKKKGPPASVRSLCPACACFYCQLLAERGAGGS